VDSRELRTCLGHFATGVTVVSTGDLDDPHGATVNAFTAVSLDPPLVQVTLDRRARAARRLPGASFTVNVLAREQLGLALHFAGRPQEGVAPRWWQAATAAALDGCTAWLSCRPWAAYDGGDHVLFLGEVDEVRTADRFPLVFHRGRFHDLDAGRTPGPTPWEGSIDSPTGPGWFHDPLLLPA
jgi:flavin reductase (DIM6/NTAB) family NADH-FMN oxidoreductase RutF